MYHVTLAQERMPCGAEPSGTFGHRFARCAAWSSTPSVDADPNADDDDQVPDGGPLPPDVVDSAAELKQARARALWHLKSHIASAVVRVRQQTDIGSPPTCTIVQGPRFDVGGACFWRRALF